MTLSFTTLFLVLSLSLFPHSTTSCTVEDTQALLDTLFSSLGNDCDLWFSLYADTALYYHQHDGFKTYDQLLATCQNYASFCPGGDNPCSFRQEGIHQVYLSPNNDCHILAPYLWSEIPANHNVPNNLEPHTGWEYIIAEPDSSSAVNYKMTHFAEIETSYAVAYNRADPEDTSVYFWTTNVLEGTASNGECDTPIASTVTNYFAFAGGRQQLESVVLSTGGLCHVAVPYAEERGGEMTSGVVVMILQPTETSYDLEMTTTFPIGPVKDASFEVLPKNDGYQSAAAGHPLLFGGSSLFLFVFFVLFF